MWCGKFTFSDTDGGLAITVRQGRRQHQYQFVAACYHVWWGGRAQPAVLRYSPLQDLWSGTEAIVLCQIAWSSLSGSFMEIYQGIRTEIPLNPAPPSQAAVWDANIKKTPRPTGKSVQPRDLRIRSQTLQGQVKLEEWRHSSKHSHADNMKNVPTRCPSTDR